jgi:hypothetical protein
MTPELKARVSIDALLVAADWHARNVADANSRAIAGVAISEFILDSGFGFANYLPAWSRPPHLVWEFPGVAHFTSGSASEPLAITRPFTSSSLKRPAAALATCGTRCWSTLKGIGLAWPPRPNPIWPTLLGFGTRFRSSLFCLINLGGGFCG